MSRRTTAIAAALSVLALGSPLMTGCTNPLETQYLNQGVENMMQAIIKEQLMIGVKQSRLIHSMLLPTTIVVLPRMIQKIIKEQFLISRRS